MSNEIVKYHHELNTIPLRKFTPVEMNLFFSIVSRMRDVGDKKVQFTFEQLKDLSNYKATANVRFIDDLETTYDKLMDLRFGRRSADGLQRERFVYLINLKSTENLIFLLLKYKFMKKPYPYLIILKNGCAILSNNSMN
ncbi:replication initiation protein [Enterococcus faecium]|uniref:replication initiation protein n=1 Tax=Enterococcus faecium TaxID=1352 RepID=UPI00202EF32A|nr:replication initiation protein [Enterococcus faecium]URT59780.1 replication initiation protein [Enterococcus faecium]